MVGLLVLLKDLKKLNMVVFIFVLLSLYAFLSLCWSIDVEFTMAKATKIIVAAGYLVYIDVAVRKKYLDLFKLNYFIVISCIFIGLYGLPSYEYGVRLFLGASSSAAGEFLHSFCFVFFVFVRWSLLSFSY